MLLSFDAVLYAPHAGEDGTLQAASTDGNPWSAQQPVTLAKAGENVVTLQVPSSGAQHASTALGACMLRRHAVCLEGMLIAACYHACHSATTGMGAPDCAVHGDTLATVLPPLDPPAVLARWPARFPASP